MVSRREISQIFSRGTYASIQGINGEDLLGEGEAAGDAKYILCLARDTANETDGIQLGVCFFDMSTLKCYIGNYVDGPSLSRLRSLLSSTRPLELVYEKAQL